MTTLNYIWEAIKGIISIFIALLILSHFNNPFEIIAISSLIIIYIRLAHGLEALGVSFSTSTIRQHLQFKELYNLIKYKPTEEKIDVPIFSPEYINEITKKIVNKNSDLTEDEKDADNLLRKQVTTLTIKSFSNWAILIICFFYILLTIAN